MIDPVERIPPRSRIDARRVRQGQRRVSTVPEFYPLMLRRQKARPPQAVVKRRVVQSAAAEGGENDVRRELSVLIPKSVADPGPNAGPARQLVSRFDRT